MLGTLSELLDIQQSVWESTLLRLPERILRLNQQAFAAGRELKAELSPETVGGEDWSLREFALFVPMGPMPEDQAAAFRAEAVAAGALPERPSRWWPWAKTKPLLRLSTPP